MQITDVEVRHLPGRKRYTALSAAIDSEVALKLLEGRWKLVILFQLFGGQVRRFSELHRGVEGISERVLTQQLRQLEADGIVERIAHATVPPRVDYRLTAWGQQLCPVLDALLMWAEARPSS